MGSLIRIAFVVVFVQRCRLHVRSHPILLLLVVGALTPFGLGVLLLQNVSLSSKVAQ